MPMQSPEARVLCADRVSVTYPGLRQRPGGRAAERQPDHPARRVRGGAGSIRLRQDHAAEPAGGLSVAHGGRITLAGRPIEGPGADRGVVFQKHALLPWLNVLENTEFGLMLQGVDKQTRPAPAATWSWSGCRTFTAT